MKPGELSVRYSVTPELSTRINYGLLVFSILTTSINILPLVVIPMVCAILVLLSACLVGVGSIDFRLYSGFRKWFILYMVISLVYAGFSGVDILDYRLYRREFKYMFSFSYLILFSSLYYPNAMSRSIKYLLAWLSIANFLLLAVALANPDLINSRVYYPFSGSIWDYISDDKKIYQGLFISHSAAGGFYSVLTLLQIGALSTVKVTYGRRLLVAGVLSSAVCLSYSGSRAFMLGTSSVLGLLLLNYLINAYKKGTYVNISRFALVSVTAGICVAGLSSSMSLKIQDIVKLGNYRYENQELGSGPESDGTVEEYDKHVSLDLVPVFEDEDTRKRNIEVRFWLWNHAIENFLKSPFIGVGPSRYDDDPAVIRTLPESAIKIFHPNDEVGKEKIEFLEVPYFNVNISRFVYHTDQHAHNAYLHILAEGGIAFFLLFIIMYGRLVSDLLKIHRHTDDDEERGLVQGTLLALASVSIASFFGNNIMGVIPIITIAAVSAYLLRPRGVIIRN